MDVQMNSDGWIYSTDGDVWTSSIIYRNGWISSMNDKLNYMLF